MTYISQYKRPRSPDLDYRVKQDIVKIDFSHIIDKRVHKEPMPKGLYGYTYINSGEMYINDSLSEEQNYKTQVHEAIHTDDEYETRILENLITDIDEEKISSKFKKEKERHKNAE